jgi:uncharacterized protein YbcI
MLSGEARAMIASEIFRLHSEYYGMGPTKAKVHGSGDVIAVVLEETFTRAERTLSERGEAEGIKGDPASFQRVMAEQFTAIVEQASGRKVRSFFSDTDLDEDLSVEMFILADGRTDMTDFEVAEKPEPGFPASGPVFSRPRSVRFSSGQTARRRSFRTPTPPRARSALRLAPDLCGGGLGCVLCRPASLLRGVGLGLRSVRSLLRRASRRTLGLGDASRRRVALPRCRRLLGRC